MSLSYKNQHPIAIVEVLILQRFPYHKDSAFFYFASKDLLGVEEGDIVTVPWRKGEKNGVVIKTKKIITEQDPLKEWQINLNNLTKNIGYFHSPVPNKIIKLKPIKEILEKKYFSPALLENLRIASQKYFVSWNHFVQSAVELPKTQKRKINLKTNLLFSLSKWALKFKKSYHPLKLIKKSQIQKTNNFIFAAYDQEAQLQKILEETLLQKKQILILVPEKSHVIPVASKYSALTNSFASSSPILLGKFLPKTIFKNAWQATRVPGPFVFIGTRSAIFAPYSNLGLIILEDGHDTNHKQWDLSPLYDLRKILPLLYPDTPKIYLSSTPRMQDIFNSPYVLSGNKTISVKKIDFDLIGKNSIKETENELKENSPSLVTQKIQYENRKKKITLINIITDRKLSDNISSISKHLESKLISALKKGESAMILANHGGVANLVICRDCGLVLKCKHCDKVLSYDKKNSLYCNFCGLEQNSQKSCSRCKGFNFDYKNFGIEKIKEDLEILKKRVNFNLVLPPNSDSPNFKISNFAEELLGSFARPTVLLGYSGFASLGRIINQINPKIALTAIIDFDGILFSPDYNAFEKAAAKFYNALAISSDFYIQTTDPSQPFLKNLLKNPYSAQFYAWAKERKEYFYPPFSKIYLIDVPFDKKNGSQATAENIAHYLNTHTQVIESLVLPITAHSKQKKYRASVLVKFEKGSNPETIINSLFRNYSNLRIDPDPYA